MDRKLMVGSIHQGPTSSSGAMNFIVDHPDDFLYHRIIYLLLIFLGLNNPFLIDQVWLQYIINVDN